MGISNIRATSPADALAYVEQREQEKKQLDNEAYAADSTARNLIRSDAIKEACKDITATGKSTVDHFANRGLFPGAGLAKGNIVLLLPMQRKRFLRSTTTSMQRVIQQLPMWYLWNIDTPQHLKHTLVLAPTGETCIYLGAESLKGYIDINHVPLHSADEVWPDTYPSELEKAKIRKPVEDHAKQIIQSIIDLQNLVP